MGRSSRAKTGSPSGTVRFAVRLAPGTLPVVATGTERFDDQLSGMLQRALSARPLGTIALMSGQAKLERGVMSREVRDAADGAITNALSALAGGAAGWESGERAGLFWLRAALEPLAPSAATGYTGPVTLERREPPVPSQEFSPPPPELLNILRTWSEALPPDPVARMGGLTGVSQAVRAALVPHFEAALRDYLRTLRPINLEQKERVAEWVNATLAHAGLSLVMPGEVRAFRLDVYSYRPGSPGRFRILPKGSSATVASANNLTDLLARLHVGVASPDATTLREPVASSDGRQGIADLPDMPRGDTPADQRGR